MNITELVKERENALNVKFVTGGFANNDDYIVVAYREMDDTYIVWTAYASGDLRAEYNGFYNGTYDMTKDQALQEMKRRLEKQY